MWPNLSCWGKKKSLQRLIFLSIPVGMYVQRLLGVFIRSFYFNHPRLGLPGETADVSLNSQAAT